MRIKHLNDYSKRVTVVAATYVLATFAIAHSTSATIIVDDTFTAANSTPLVGRFPAPTDLPGSAYAGNGNVSLVGGPTGGSPYEADIQANTARLGSDVGVGLNLGISTPTQFQLSITFNISNDNQTQADDGRRGAGLGFFSNLSTGTSGSSHGFQYFTGLAVDRTGSVRLIIGGTDSGIFTTIAGFDPTINHTLSYQVNTATGNGLISNILLDAAIVSLTAPTNTFTTARTVYGGFYNSSGGTNEVASFDDFSIATVPEPSALIGVVGIVVAAILHRRLRMRRDVSATCEGKTL